VGWQKGGFVGKLHRLNSLAVQKINKQGRFSDGGGLYLQVTKGSSKSWIFRYMRNNIAREMGLGSANAVTLSEARELAFEARRILTRGSDPLEVKMKRKKQKALNLARQVTFSECTEAFINAHESKWKNKKHADQWRYTLRIFAYPLVGNLPIQAVDTTLMIKILEPLWLTKTETASRLRGRIENIISYATVRQWRVGENPLGGADTSINYFQKGQKWLR